MSREIQIVRSKPIPIYTVRYAVNDSKLYAGCSKSKWDIKRRSKTSWINNKIRTIFAQGRSFTYDFNSMTKAMNRAKKLLAIKEIKWVQVWEHYQ